MMKSESMRALCGNYFKAGDAKYEITISPIRGDGENALRVWVSKKEKESAGAVIAREFEIGADEGSREYKVYDLGSYEEGEERESFWFDVSEASSGKLSLTRADSAQEHGEEAVTAFCMTRVTAPTRVTLISFPMMPIPAITFCGVTARIHFLNRCIRGKFM